MSEVARVMLTAGGATGLQTGFRLAGDDRPRQVCLGAVLPKARKNVLRLAPFLPQLLAAPVPAAVDYSKKAPCLSRMYLNDQKGCCVISGKYHSLGVWSAEDNGPDLTVPDQTIAQMYAKLAVRPGYDTGCVITDVLDYFRDRGLPVNGGVHTIDGYVSVDNTNPTETKTALYLFGASTIGINLPQEWLNSSVWDVTDSQIVGGHDVSPIGYDAKGVYVSSWGKKYLITWQAWTSNRYLSEFYAMLAPDWYGPDKKAAAVGVDMDQLKNALALLGGGQVPPIPDPIVPPAPPGPGPSPSIWGQLIRAVLDLLRSLFAQRVGRPMTAAEEGAAYAVLTTAALSLPDILPLLLKYGPIVLPVILAGVQAGKRPILILWDVLQAVRAAQRS